jgi:proteasome lid subunit RPN8/RPN11
MGRDVQRGFIGVVHTDTRYLSLPVRSVSFRRDVVDSIFTYSKMAYPKEGILLLRGSSKKGVVEVESVAIPPLATHGDGFSSFNWNMIPIDLSFLGVAHSHPSGYAVPSQQDLLHVMGRIMVIAGYPYSEDSCLKVYDSHGNSLQFVVK